MPCFTLSGVTISIAQLVPGGEHPERACRDQGQAYPEHRQAYSRRHVGDAEKAIAESVDQVEKRVGVRQSLPYRRERKHRVEDARKKKQRQEDKSLGRRKPGEALRSDTPD